MTKRAGVVLSRPLEIRSKSRRGPRAGGAGGPNQADLPQGVRGQFVCDIVREDQPNRIRKLIGYGRAQIRS